MNLNQFYHYYKSKSGGGVPNFLKATEDFDSSIDWNKLPSTDAPTVSGGITDPNGGSDAQRINFTDNRQARVQQRVSLSASTQYTFSVYARVNTGTEQFRLRNVTLGEAEAKTATTSWTRFSYTFTTTTGGNYDLSIQNTSNDAKTIEFWGAMLNVGASANAYVKVDPSISGSTPTPAYSGFGDTYGDVTAYYSLRKFTEAETLNAIRVRRSSDDTEQDIGFDANGDLDTTALTTFVNADVDTYTSDFSSGIDGFVQSQVTASSVDGITDGTTSKDDVIQSVLTGGSNSHYIYRNGIFDLSNTYDVSFEYYIPSVRPDGVTPQTIDGLAVRTGSGTDGIYSFSVVDSWQSETIQNWSPTLNNSLLFMCSVGGSTASIDADGDVYYLKNIVVTQTTADGAVTTFYDQSGNGNDATNSTASEQPLVVSGGSVVTMGGASKPAIQGSTSSLALTTALTPTDFSIIHTSEGSGFVANINEYIRISTYYRLNISGNNYISNDANAANQSIYVSNRNGTTLNLRRNGSEMSGSPHTSVTSALNITSIFNRSSLYFVGKISEFIIFESDQSSNLTGIESNINDHFSIYP